MTITANLGRPLLAGIFVVGGIGQLRDPSSRRDAARRVGGTLDRVVPDNPLPSDPDRLIRLNGAVQVVAGSMMALDIVPRAAALALTGSLIPTTLGAHAFWAEDDPDEKKRERVAFAKNAAILGGLLMVAGDTGGRPSVGWQARRAARDARAATAELKADTVELSADVADAVRTATADLKAGTVSRRSEVADAVRAATADLRAETAARSTEAAHAVRSAGRSLTEAARHVGDLAADAAEVAGDMARDLADPDTKGRAAELADRLGVLAERLASDAAHRIDGARDSVIDRAAGAVAKKVLLRRR